MKKDVAYIVSIITSYSFERSYSNLFVTEDKDMAERWVKKYNILLARWSSFYHEEYMKYPYVEDVPDWIYDRYNSLQDIDGAHIEEIKVKHV